MRVTDQRLFRVASVLLIGSLVVACAAPEPVPSPAQPTPSALVAILAPDVPLRVVDRAAMDTCMASAGYTVHPASSGSNGVYAWERSSSYSWDAGDQIDPLKSGECLLRFPRARPKTRDEQREIYMRWVLEWQCLKSLGFHSNRPPSFEAFHATWNTGPWSPVQNLPLDRLGGRARDTCGLEMIP